MSNRKSIAALLMSALLACSVLADDRSAGRHLDDSTIAVDAKAALIGRKGVSANHINIEVAKGVLLLAGFVSSEEERAQALKAVRYLNGVEKTIDGMVVSAGKRSFGQTVDDTTIQTRLKSRLASMEGAGKALAINTEVHRGEVILSGFLSDQTVIDSAAKVAASVPGVTAVHNMLRLIP